jgi:alanine racemase
MVDVSNVTNVDVGDDVYIWDNELITLEDIAKIYDTINYEVLSGIGERVPRVFID